MGDIIEHNYLLDAMFLNICQMYRARKNRKRRRRRWGVRPINVDWQSSGYHHRVFLKVKNLDEQQFFEHTRMTRPAYQSLLNLVSRALRKKKQRILPEERLSATLLYLAQGTSFQDIAHRYKLGRSTIRQIVLETCELLWTVLSPIYVNEPTEAQYVEIVNEFNKLWNVPNCVGAIDAKHIVISSHNEKKLSSIVLMATCDANYNFTAISIGKDVSLNDGGVFHFSQFGKSLMESELPLPPHKPLSTKSMLAFPHYFVGDAGFPLKNNLMRPYSGLNLNERMRIFNYRLARVSRVIENSFGILSSRWQVLCNTIECSRENSEKIVLGCIALHNFVMLNDEKRWYCPDKFIDWEGADHVVQNGSWRDVLNCKGGPLHSLKSSTRRGPMTAVHHRDILADYFTKEGAVPFQNIFLDHT